LQKHCGREYHRPMTKSLPSESSIPDYNWYQERSAKLRLTGRCPFASAKLCPRFFRTLWLLDIRGF
jgi:hypothetical protein